MVAPRREIRNRSFQVGAKLNEEVCVQQGLKLFLAPDTRIPKWLRRAMRRESGIRFRYARLERRQVPCLLLPHSVAHITRGGSIELKVPGEVAFRDGLFADTVLQVQDFRGRKIIINLLLCRSCVLPTGVRLAGSTEIRCTVCGHTWKEEEALA